MEANNNLICQKVKSKVNIRDAQEIMEYIWRLQEIVFEKGDRMEDGVYTELMDTLLEMSGGEFYIELDTIARKTPKAEYTRIKAEDMRRYVKQHPDKGVICDRCDTPLMKQSLAKHLQSRECKDKAYTIIASGGVVGNKEILNEKILDEYENQTELPEVELTKENYYWTGNMFQSDY